MAEMRDRGQGLPPGAERSTKASGTRVVAILASHNRRAETLACLSSYFAQSVGPDISLSAVVVDDGSDDGTAAAVRDQFPNTRVVIGGGDMFWAPAMATAEQVARTSDPDFLLWLNDDVVLDEDALRRLMDTGVGAPETAYIAVGAVRDPVSGEVTYSGLRRSRLHPLRVTLIHPTDKPVEVDTFNGNVVLVSRAAFKRVGHIDGEFEHAAADHDYGLRAANVGVRRLLAPGTVGTCEKNPAGEPWADPALTVRDRFRILISRKGHPPRSSAHYLRRHGGPAWPIFWLSPYIRALPSVLRRRRPSQNH
jgi:GT2 family glycosyltransferase